MIRKPRSDYPIKAFLRKRDEDRLFWCTVSSVKVITTDVGQEMANGSKVLKTPSNLEFEINDKIVLGNETVTVDSVTDELNKKDKSARRGNPTFIQRLEVS